MTTKNFFAAAILLLLAACSTEQPTPTPAGVEDMSVTLNAGVDAEMTRADAAPDGYQMRYILRIIGTDPVTEPTTITQTSPKFSFLLAQGTYDLMMWADYVPTGTTADKYYDTSDLTAVERIAPTASDDYEALDAFYYYTSVVKEAAAKNLGNVTLLRPLARINLVEKLPAMYEDEEISKIVVTYTPEAPQSLNVKDGTLAAVADAPDAEAISVEITDISKNFFCNYLFAPNESAGKTGKSMTVAFYTTDDVQVGETFTIPAGMPYERNRQTDLEAAYLANGSVTAYVQEWNAESITKNPAIMWDGNYPNNAGFIGSTAETDSEAEYITLAQNTLGDVNADGSYHINTPAQFAAFAWLVNYNSTTNATYGVANYKLMTDIDLNDHPWTPIGTGELPFSGTFDGGGHKIIGLNVSGVPFAGLFGVGGIIKYLMVEGNVAGSGGDGFQAVGGIAGQCLAIGFCSFKGTVSASNIGGADNLFIGSIVGFGVSLNNISLASEIKLNDDVTTSERRIGAIAGSTPQIYYSSWLSSMTVTPSQGGALQAASGNDGGGIINTYASEAALLDAWTTVEGALNTPDRVNALGMSVEYNWAKVGGELVLVPITPKEPTPQ